MFSHTTKGQLYNMALLSKFLSPGGQNVHNSNIHTPRLIDYELLTAEDGKRCVGFGWFAGGESVSGSRYLSTNSMCSVAGTLESLCAMAHAHLELGVASPFLVSFCLTCLSSSDVYAPFRQYTPRPHTHPSLASIRATLKEVGARIASDGAPRSLGPIVLGVTGSVYSFTRSSH